MGKKDRVEKNADDKECFGGVILTNADKTIVCKNSLDARVIQCFEESLPDTRQLMFPEVKKK